MRAPGEDGNKSDLPLQMGMCREKAKCFSAITAITVEGTQAVSLVTEPLLHTDKRLFSLLPPAKFRAAPCFLVYTGIHTSLIFIPLYGLKHLR